MRIFTISAPQTAACPCLQALRYPWCWTVQAVTAAWLVLCRCCVHWAITCTWVGKNLKAFQAISTTCISEQGHIHSDLGNYTTRTITIKVRGFPLKRRVNGSSNRSVTLFFFFFLQLRVRANGALLVGYKALCHIELQSWKGNMNLRDFSV